MKYDIILSNRFRKDLKIVKKRGYDLGLLDEVVTVLANGEKLQPHVDCQVKLTHFYV